MYAKSTNRFAIAPDPLAAKRGRVAATTAATTRSSSAPVLSTIGKGAAEFGRALVLLGGQSSRRESRIPEPRAQPPSKVAKSAALR